MINWDRVRELQRDIGSEEFDEIVAIFIDEVNETAQNLREGETLQTLEMLLHSLKNSALNLGLSDLSEQCQSAEIAARAGQTDAVNLPMILQLLDHSIEQFKAGLPAQTAA